MFLKLSLLCYWGLGLWIIASAAPAFLSLYIQRVAVVSIIWTYVLAVLRTLYCSNHIHLVIMITVIMATVSAWFFAYIKISTDRPCICSSCRVYSGVDIGLLVLLWNLLDATLVSSVNTCTVLSRPLIAGVASSRFSEYQLIFSENEAIVDSRLRPQSCCHLAKCIEMQ